MLIEEKEGRKEENIMKRRK